MSKIRQIAYGGVGGAFIAIVAFIGNIIRIGYIIDPLLIPFSLMFIKHKHPTYSMLPPTLVASVLLLPYKYYLVLYIIAYYIIASVVWKVGEKINPWNVTRIALTYTGAYFGSVFLIATLIYGLNFKEILFSLTGFGMNKKGLIAALLVIEPITYAVALQLLLEKIKGYRM